MNRSFTLPSREDWVSSLVVFVVALPLTLGIALASGASASSALVCAMIGGILVGLLSGAPLVVSGPAAGLASLVFLIIQNHGLLGLAIATLIAGLFQVTLGTLRLGYIFNYVPKSILEGMLAAIGLTILLGQLHVALGHKTPSNPLLSISTLPDSIQGATLGITLLALFAILIQLIWPKVVGRYAWIPGALPAVIIMSVASLALTAIPRVELLPLADALKEQIGVWSSFSFSNLDLSLILEGIGLGFVASAESLLTARAIGTIAEKRGLSVQTNLDRELLAQGTGNTLCSALGALPMTGVIVRSAANIESGAKSRWSTILHGVWITLFVVALPQVLNVIPLAVLASVLILTGWKLLNLKQVIQNAKIDRMHTAFWVLTLVSILGTDLLKGLIISIAIYVAYTLTMKQKTKQAVRT